jgi:hypothetical protein
MKAIDFSRSFLTFRIDTQSRPPQTVSHKPPFSLNNARIQVECRCVVTEMETGWSDTFILGANCKTERVGVERDIWTEPNADFVPIYSGLRFMNLKTYARTGIGVELYPPGSGMQSDRQTGSIAEAFDSFDVRLVECPGALLPSAAEVVEATLANCRLNARTTIQNDRYRAVIEYPARTMNANERDGIYQADTGPVLLPDLSVEPHVMLENLELAFAAFNCPTWTEFLVRVPTPVSADIEVYHFARSLRWDAANEVIRLQ